MGVKKALLTACMSLAMLAVALPAMASAAEIKDAGNQLVNREIEFTGTVRTLNPAVNGIECTVHARINVNKATVEVKKFESTATSCVIVGTTYKNCIVKTTKTTGLDWALKSNATNLKLETGLVDTEFESKTGTVCPTKTYDVTMKDVSLTPDNVNAIKNFFISGQVIVDLDAGKEEKAELSGTLPVQGTDSGTFEYS